ncbi:hypothetical protein CDAR_185541 [Caerostris darwini]|uniref:Uncharacterized protein n=1 Tax=Caerostris darwini TaxID=1538125 RepID=A0AAV4NDT6_9ARAC|nr:hypothetical protein CDAR_185541 [Caerostris darwini]
MFALFLEREKREWDGVKEYEKKEKNNGERGEKKGSLSIRGKRQPAERIVNSFFFFPLLSPPENKKHIVVSTKNQRGTERFTRRVKPLKLQTSSQTRDVTHVRFVSGVRATDMGWEKKRKIMPKEVEKKDCYQSESNATGRTHG